jgi:phosphatidylglycerophosphate synthase
VVPTVYVDYRGRDGIAAMVVGGMTVAERVLREAAKAGADKAVVHGSLPELPQLPLSVEVRPAAEPAPEDAALIAGDAIAGVTISDEDSRRRASRALFASCRRPHDGLADKYIIRGVSTRVSRVLCAIGATPNQVTSANIVVGLAACALVAVGTVASIAGGGALMFLQLVLDSCDGELARIRFMNSRLGMILDNGSDDLIDNLFVAMLGIGIGGVWMWIGIASAIARGFSAAMIHIDVARRGKPGDVMAFKWFFDSEGEALTERFETKGSAAGTARAFGRRDMYGFIWAATCVAGIPVVGLGLSVVLSWVYFVLAVAHLVVMARR